MIVTDCKYDPVRDLAPVEQFGFIDLKTALSESVVPSQMPDSDADYNGIDDPDKILGKPADIFDAIDSQKAIEQAASAAAANETDGQQKDS